MPRTREELEAAAADAERWLDEMDPVVLADPASRADDLRDVGAALAEVAAAERHLAEAVEAARANGRSWGLIAIVLGVSRQAARDRFGGAAEPSPKAQAGAHRFRTPNLPGAGRAERIYFDPVTKVATVTKATKAAKSTKSTKAAKAAKAAKPAKVPVHT
jgi:hypothetical protein